MAAANQVNVSTLNHQVMGKKTEYNRRSLWKAIPRTHGRSTRLPSLINRNMATRWLIAVTETSSSKSYGSCSISLLSKNATIQGKPWL